MATSDADKELMELQRSVMQQGQAAGLPHADAAIDPTAITTAHARRAAQREAYGQFVALGPIHIGNTMAFSPGQQVPLEHVIKFGLEEQELVARVADAERARLGKTFSDDEFAKANPHVPARTSVPGELHPAALDPRGAARHLDTEGRHGEIVGGASPADPAGGEAHMAAAGQAAADIVAAGDKADEKPAKSTRAAAKSEEK